MKGYTQFVFAEPKRPPSSSPSVTAGGAASSKGKRKRIKVAIRDKTIDIFKELLADGVIVLGQRMKWPSIYDTIVSQLKSQGITDIPTLKQVKRIWYDHFHGGSVTAAGAAAAGAAAASGAVASGAAASGAAASGAAAATPKFKIGDDVKIKDMPVADAIKLVELVSGWDPEMANCLGKVGKIISGSLIFNSSTSANIFDYKVKVSAEIYTWPENMLEPVSKGPADIFEAIELDDASAIEAEFQSDVTTKNSDGKTPMYVAVDKNKINSLYALFLFTPVEIGAFGRAIELSRIECLDAMIDIVGPDFLSNPPSVYYAVQRKQMDALKFLISKKADINKQMRGGWAPIHLAAEEEWLPGLEELLKSPDISINRGSDANNVTALHSSASDGKFMSVAMLVKYGADLDRKTLAGKTAKELAVTQFVWEFLMQAKLMTNPNELKEFCDNAMGNNLHQFLFLPLISKHTRVKIMDMPDAARYQKAVQGRLTQSGSLLPSMQEELGEVGEVLDYTLRLKEGAVYQVRVGRRVPQLWPARLIRRDYEFGEPVEIISTTVMPVADAKALFRTHGLPPFTPAHALALGKQTFVGRKYTNTYVYTISPLYGSLRFPTAMVKPETYNIGDHVEIKHMSDQEYYDIFRQHLKAKLNWNARIPQAIRDAGFVAKVVYYGNTFQDKSRRFVTVKLPSLGSSIIEFPALLVSKTDKPIPTPATSSSSTAASSSSSSSSSAAASSSPAAPAAAPAAAPVTKTTVRVTKTVRQKIYAALDLIGVSYFGNVTKPPWGKVVNWTKTREGLIKFFKNLHGTPNPNPDPVLGNNFPYTNAQLLRVVKRWYQKQTATLAKNFKKGDTVQILNCSADEARDVFDKYLQNTYIWDSNMTSQLGKKAKVRQQTMVLQLKIITSILYTRFSKFWWPPQLLTKLSGGAAASSSSPGAAAASSSSSSSSSGAAAAPQNISAAAAPQNISSAIFRPRTTATSQWEKIDVAANFAAGFSLRIAKKFNNPVAFYKGTLKKNRAMFRIDFDDGTDGIYDVFRDTYNGKFGATPVGTSGASKDEIRPLFTSKHTLVVLNLNFVGPLGTSIEQGQSRDYKLEHDGNRWRLNGIANGSKLKMSLRCSSSTSPSHGGWVTDNGDRQRILVIRSFGQDEEIPSVEEYLRNIKVHCDIENDLTGSNTPDWREYPAAVQTMLREQWREYILNDGADESDGFSIGSGEYTVNFKICAQTRTNAGSGGNSGYQRPIRIVHPQESGWSLPPAPAPAAAPPPPLPQTSSASVRSQFHRDFPNIVNNLPGQWSGGVVPEIMRTGIPASLTGPQKGAFFDWRAQLPYTMDRVSYKVVDYYKFADADEKLQRLINLCENYKNDYPSKVPSVHCSTMYHGTSFDAVEPIMKKGFKHMGTMHGAVCGRGSYFAVHPYLNYTCGNSRYGTMYITSSRGYAPVFICVGAVVPGEYTWDHNDNPDLPGRGLPLDGNETKNPYGICGGSFYPTKVQADGTMHMNHREVTFWWSKQVFKTIVGLAIISRN